MDRHHGSQPPKRLPFLSRRVREAVDFVGRNASARDSDAITSNTHSTGAIQTLTPVDDTVAGDQKAPKISSLSRVRFRSGDCEDKNRMDRACCRALADLFLRANAARHLVGIPVGIRSNRRLKLLQLQFVMLLSDCRPGAPTRLFKPVLKRPRGARKPFKIGTSAYFTIASRSIPAVQFVGIERTNVHGEIRCPE